MSSTINYKQLFSVNVLHQYFLKDAKTAYDDKEKPDAFVAYNSQNFMRIVPSAKAKKVLKNHKILIKQVNNGVTALASADSANKPSFDLTGQSIDLLVYITDEHFNKYTEGVDLFGTHVYEFKTSTAASSRKLVAQGTDWGTAKIADYKLAFSDVAGNDYVTLMERIAPEEKRQLFGVITVDLAALLNSGVIKSTADEFKMVFNNRSIICEYVSAVDGSVKHTSAAAEPLVKRGWYQVEKSATEKFPMPTILDEFEFPATPNAAPTKIKIYV